jgi:hypothetical protein
MLEKRGWVGNANGEGDRSCGQCCDSQLDDACLGLLGSLDQPLAEGGDAAAQERPKICVRG